MEIPTAKKSLLFSLILIVFACSPKCFSQNATGFDSSKLLLSKSKKGRVKMPEQSADWLYTALEVNYVMLNALDLITTFKSLNMGAEEVNPIARSFVKNKPLAIMIKSISTGGVLFALSEAKRQDKKAAYVTLGLLNLLYGFVVHNNISVYLQMRN